MDLPTTSGQRSLHDFAIGNSTGIVYEGNFLKTTFQLNVTKVNLEDTLSDTSAEKVSSSAGVALLTLIAILPLIQRNIPQKKTRMS
ncbi:MAG: hypothetical protein D6732_03965 [Methanobacteriota archaeon]|nr:MAG: hypothetical protein D6732_03965 [Euryarchaeota archaeon]